MTSRTMHSYLSDPLLKRVYDDMRAAGPVRAIAVDLTQACNLRCAGCYFYAEGLDRSVPPPEEAFDRFIAGERARGTNFVTVVGGEPALALGRLKKLYDAFRISVATNGWRRIPREGFEHLPIGVAVWGDRTTDRMLRGGGMLDVFSRALKNYEGDDRAFWYYTTSPGRAHEIESVVERCIANGNAVLFNFSVDIGGETGNPGRQGGFEAVRREIDRMIDRYPDRILLPSYVAGVVATGSLYGEHWGYEVCTSVSADAGVNRRRVANGHVFSPHFRAYNADLISTRRCCTGNTRDCALCFDVWQHFSWIILNLRKHLHSQEEFTCWLSAAYAFYVANRIVDITAGARLLAELHLRMRNSEDPAQGESEHASAEAEAQVE